MVIAQSAVKTEPDGIFPFAFCQNDRLALALLHVVGQGSMRRRDLGTAFHDGLVSVFKSRLVQPSN